MPGSGSPAGSPTSPTAAPGSWTPGSAAPGRTRRGSIRSTAAAGRSSPTSTITATSWPTGSTPAATSRLTEAMNGHDLGRGRGGMEAALADDHRPHRRRGHRQRPALPARAAGAARRRDQRRRSRYRSCAPRTGTTASSSRATRSPRCCAARRLGSALSARRQCLGDQFRDQRVADRARMDVRGTGSRRSARRPWRRPPGSCRRAPESSSG